MPRKYLKPIPIIILLLSFSFILGCSTTKNKKPDSPSKLLLDAKYFYKAEDAKIAKDQNMLLMVCDQCAVRRNLAEGTLDQCGTGQVKAAGLVDGVVAGCFPQLYEAPSSNPPDQVITL